MNLQYFGNDDVLEDIDATIILGDFHLEANEMPPKLLLLRLSGMLCNQRYSRQDKDEIANSIYSAIRPITGKRGYEMRRFGGSSGSPTHESDLNLLRVLAENKGVLPRKAWATVILRGRDRYYDIYRKCNVSEGKPTFTHVEYSPPRDGGQFSMPDICIARYPVLGEMSYLKMQCVTILVALNKIRVANNEEPVAIGPIEQEMRSIQRARKSYKSSPDSMRMHNFISVFNKCNGYSMVAYPVGMHLDRFREGESLENKILFTMRKPRCGSRGRGGSILGDRYVFALLDW